MPPTEFDPSTFDYQTFKVGLDNATAKSGPPRASIAHTIAARAQGTVDCCTAVAAVTAMEAMYQLAPAKSEALSVLYLYWKARGGANAPISLQIYDALKAAAKGICPARMHERPIMQELELPLPTGNEVLNITPDMAGKVPSGEADEEAKKYKIQYDSMSRKSSYWKIRKDDCIAAWRFVIQQNRPVIFGFKTSKEYWNLENKEDGRLGTQEPSLTEALHAAVVLGYNDAREEFEVKDSRGNKFGKGGRWHMPYTLANSSMIRESWIIGGITSWQS